MGILGDRIKKKLNDFSFHPLDLNEHNVNVLFQRCLATDSTTSTVESRLFGKFSGFDADSEVITFDKNIIDAYRPRIKFLLGQIGQDFENTSFLYVQNLNKKYDGTIWTNDIASFLKLVLLAQASEDKNGITIINPIVKRFNACTFYDIVKTISPNDPNFESWWEEHKAEWED